MNQNINGNYFVYLNKKQNNFLPEEINSPSTYSDWPWYFAKILLQPVCCILTWLKKTTQTQNNKTKTNTAKQKTKTSFH